MDAFRRLMSVSLLAGSVAGLLLFAVQARVVMPLIAEAERYEHAAQVASGEIADVHAEWQPADGFERTAYTALGTTLTGIAYAALLFGTVALLQLPVEGWRAWALGLAGFACFALGPSLGLPPRPPGAAAPDLQAAQVWWIATALATAVGLWLVTSREASWQARSIGVICLVAPHAIGAPAVLHADSLPRALIRSFALASVGSQAVFWLTLGKLGGRLYERHREQASSPNQP